ncbi:MAG: hypothetical protein LBS95_01100, partial [Mycoplasmataceae bacterium]|nr:hypothetical protein [Mycoplasmataceae bacterium]
MTKKIKIISTLATLSFISPSLSPPLSLSLSLSLLSLNFSPKTGVDAITKTGLSDLFAGQTDLGSFSSAPTKASLLYRCKSIINSFHNENDSWYTITNLTSTSCTLSATDRNPFYSSSVNFDFVIGSLTPLANVISSNISQTVTTDVWDSTTDDFNIKKIFGDT